ncbi:hypothetical protein ACIRG4_32580 [Streptomyces sp. NPDC102395]|uniref:hypothetical protein n=1 Tax=Streptomyces sp. NPDC102395 TaxID=3366168 RepID=UPI00382EB589
MASTRPNCPRDPATSTGSASTLAGGAVRLGAGLAAQAGLQREQDRRPGGDQGHGDDERGAQRGPGADGAEPAPHRPSPGVTGATWAAGPGGGSGRYPAPRTVRPPTNADDRADGDQADGDDG